MEMAVAVIAYAGLLRFEGWKGRSPARFERNQLTALETLFRLRFFTAEWAAAHLRFRQTPGLVVASLLPHVPSQ